MRPRTLQRRYEELVAALDDRPQRSSNGAPACVAKTAQLETYPSGQTFYLLEFQQLAGEATEGGSADMDDLGMTDLGWNIGTGTPPEGQTVLARFDGMFWIFRYDG